MSLPPETDEKFRVAADEKDAQRTGDIDRVFECFRVADTHGCTDAHAWVTEGAVLVSPPEAIRYC